MPIPQTSVSQLPALGVPGGLARGGHHKIKRGFANGIVRAGQWVVFSGDDCLHPSAVPAGGVRGGVAVKNEKSVDGNYADNDPVDVLVAGSVYVDPEVAVTRDTQAYARFVTPGSEQKGALRNDADPASATAAIVGLTETDANVENGTFHVVLRDDVTGATYDAQFTSSTSSHAVAAAGIASAIQAAGPFTATAGSEEADKIQITIVSTTATRSVTVMSVTSVGASALSIDQQGASSAEAFAVPAYFRTTASTGVVELEVIESV